MKTALVIQAPEWLKKQRAALRSHPQFSLDRARQQMQAAVEHRRKSSINPHGSR